MEILSSLSVDAGEKYIPENIKKALNYLSENIEKSPTVKSLAEISKISEVYFRRQFREYLGESPCEYRNRLRLKKAATYLEYGEIRVQEISDSLGYATVSHFIKEFRREYGMSPLKYRTKNLAQKK